MLIQEIPDIPWLDISLSNDLLLYEWSKALWVCCSQHSAHNDGTTSTSQYVFSIFFPLCQTISQTSREIQEEWSVYFMANAFWSWNEKSKIEKQAVAEQFILNWGSKFFSLFFLTKTIGKKIVPLKSYSCSDQKRQ